MEFSEDTLARIMSTELEIIILQALHFRSPTAAQRIAASTQQSLIAPTRHRGRYLLVGHGLWDYTLPRALEHALPWASGQPHLYSGLPMHETRPRDATYVSFFIEGIRRAHDQVYVLTWDVTQPELHYELDVGLHAPWRLISGTEARGALVRQIGFGVRPRWEVFLIGYKLKQPWQHFSGQIEVDVRELPARRPKLPHEWKQLIERAIRLHQHHHAAAYIP